MSTAAPVRLVCVECRRENEPERIYCHDCGARLDRTALARSKQRPLAETPEQTHKRVSGMFDQSRGKMRALAMKCVKILVAAAVAAAVVLMLLPPDLPPGKKSDTLPPQINLDLEGMTQYRRPPALHYSEDEVNAYLAYALGKKEKLNHPLLEFKRAVLLLHPGKCELTVGRSIFGYTVYSKGVFVPELQSGKLSTSVPSGTIGRLPVHPVLMRYSSFLFADVVAAMERERKLLEHAGAMELREKEVVFSAQ